MSKYYAVQFYNSRGKCFVDESLLTKGVAVSKWEELLPTFVEEMQNGNAPEMAIWCEMESDSDYHTKLRYIHSDDCVIRHGRLYALNEVT